MANLTFLGHWLGWSRGPGELRPGDAVRMSALASLSYYGDYAARSGAAGDRWEEGWDGDGGIGKC
ncbi:MAG: hypothetical protein IMW99_00210 [Firmicutes bacterium]|nr:hypothetical protein [Bacillota bacterium]